MSSRFLILYASEEGQTKKIAEQMAIAMNMHDGVMASIQSVADAPSSFDAYAGVLVGGSVHMGRFSADLRIMVERRATELTEKHAAFYAVCMSASDTTEEAIETVEGYLHRFRAETGWSPSMMTAFGGAVAFTRLGFIKRWVMKQILAHKLGDAPDTSRDYEYTDWHSVEAFADDVVLHSIALASRVASDSIPQPQAS